MVQLHRRTLAALAVSALAAPGIVSRAEARAPSRAVTDAIAGFAKLPAASCLVIAEMKDPWKAEYEPGARRFVGSALKTFILARYLRDVEEDKRTLAEQLAVNDTHRTLNSPVFLDLTGTNLLTPKKQNRHVGKSLAQLAVQGDVGGGFEGGGNRDAQRVEEANQGGLIFVNVAIGSGGGGQ